METTPEGVLPKSSVLLCHFFLWAKGLNAKDIHREIFSVYGGKCLSHKVVYNWARNSLKGEEIAMEEQKWLRQQPNDFYGADFNTLVKRWHKCINVSGEIGTLLTGHGESSGCGWKIWPPGMGGSVNVLNKQPWTANKG
jgi:hypothetical protein